jgi:hypothetical protein
MAALNLALDSVNKAKQIIEQKGTLHGSPDSDMASKYYRSFPLGGPVRMHLPNPNERTTILPLRQEFPLPPPVESFPLPPPMQSFPLPPPQSGENIRLPSRFFPSFGVSEEKKTLL